METKDMIAALERQGYVVLALQPADVSEEAFDCAWHLLDGQPLTPDLVRQALSAADLVDETALTEQQLRFYSDVLVAAVDGGGSRHWAEGRRPVWVDDRLHSIDLRPLEDQGPWENVNPLRLHRAVLSLWRDLRGPSAEPPFTRSILDDILGGAALNEASFDAASADALVQYAVFRELRYG